MHYVFSPLSALGNKLRRSAALVAAAAILLPSFSAFCSANDERKTVRVAFGPFARVLEVDENGEPVSGYAYDYLQTVAAYAGWNLVFVPSENFSGSMRNLLEGRVELIYEVSYTEERARNMLFPDEPMGYEYYYLYASADDSSITPDDFSSLSGKTVGVTRGTTLGALLRQWCESKHVELKIVEYDDIAEKEADLLSGKIDMDLELSMVARNGLSAVEKIGASAYYVAASKNRPDLIEDINLAVNKIVNNDFYYFSRLQEKYFSDTVLSRNLTVEEKQWLEGHDTLRVGYMDGYLPFSGTDENGKPIGSGIDAIRQIVQQLRLNNELKVEFIRYRDQKKCYRDAETGKIDIAFPSLINNAAKHDYRLIGGRTLTTVMGDLIHAGISTDGTIKRMGVNKNNLMQYYYCKEEFPDAEIVFYDDVIDCLNGLLSGTSDGTVLNGLRSDALLKSGRFRSLRTVKTGNDVPLSMAFATGNIGLMLLMNRGQSLLEPGFVNKASYAYAGNLYAVTALDFLYDHIVPVIAVVALVVALAVAVIGYRISNRTLSGINKALVEKTRTIEQQRRQEVELRGQLERNQTQLERALRLAQAADRAKTTFLSSMSHDIRTPMNAIIGFAGLAAAHADDPRQVKESLSTIRRSSEHLLSLIDDVLDMSRIESGKMVLCEKPESIREIINDLRDISMADIRKKRHQFFLECSNVRDWFVFCDRQRLDRVLLNLISNAVKYTPSGGRITLRVEQKPSPDPGRAAFEFSCSDNGIGIDPAFLKTIFEPFTREETSTVSGIQGTGLGMAISKNIVEMMGGRISVASIKGEGSVFTVAVSFRKADPAAASSGGSDAADAESGAAQAEPDFQLEGRRILMVDDMEINLRIGSILLRERGLSVDTAESGKSAIAKLRQTGVGAYDFVLMDVQMPEMNGYEATAEIRNLPGGDKLKIIAFSANAFEEDRERSLQAGMDGHITKPLKIEEFLRELKRIGASSRATWS